MTRLTVKVRELTETLSALTEDSRSSDAERVVLAQTLLATSIIDACQDSGIDPASLLQLSADMVEKLVREAIPSQSLN